MPSPMGNTSDNRGLKRAGGTGELGLLERAGRWAITYRGTSSVATLASCCSDVRHEWEFPVNNLWTDYNVFANHFIIVEFTAIN